MKKPIASLLFIISLFFGIYAQAHSVDTSYSWYFKPTSGHVQPECFGNASFLKNHNTIYLGSPDEKKIYLTFDAGYEDGNVVKTLDILKENNVPAAFFVLPNLITTSTDLIYRMKNEGHLICNHSKTHSDLSQITDINSFKAELDGLEKTLFETTGFETDKFFRPPQGKFSEKNLQFADDLGYKTVFWSVAYADWDKNKQIEPEKALNLILSRVHNGAVILLHPTSTTNAAILDEFIKTLKTQGYEFASLKDFPSKDTKVNLQENEKTHIIMANRNAVKRVALTFDDGPHKDYTPEILDILKNEGADATFFIIGKNAEEYPELVLREYQEGHEIGNHTYSHPSMKKISTDELLSEIDKCQTVLENITGERPKLFRPPGGFITDNIAHVLSKNEFTPVLWSWKQDTKDWSLPSVDSVVNTVLSNITDGDIILFHDYNQKGSPTPKALKIILPKLKEMGYSFCTVSELMSIV